MPSSSKSDRVSFWRKLIAQRQSSQLTVRQLCEQAGVSPASFFDWQRRLRAADQAARPDVTPALVPVRVVEDRVAQITVELSQAVRVELAHDCDEVTLERVLRAALAACRESASC
jgi:transposase-like protein